MRMVFMPAPNTVVMAMPASTTVSRLTPAPSDSAKMMSAVAKAPAKAARGVSHSAPGAREAASSTNSPAPEFTPMTLGLASGLSSDAWISAPEVARAAPASSAAKTRGTRTFSRMLRAVSGTSAPAAHAASSGRLTEEAPSIRPAAAATASRTAVEARTTRFFGMLLIGLPSSSSYGKGPL